MIKGLTLYEIIFAMFLALFITTAINIILLYRKMSIECIYPKQKFYSLIKKFYEIFPNDIMSFKGVTFKKGMKVKIITLAQNSYEGEIIGFNDKKTICIITKSAIVTNKIKNIKEIIIIE